MNSKLFSWLQGLLPDLALLHFPNFFSYYLSPPTPTFLTPQPCWSSFHSCNIQPLPGSVLDSCCCLCWSACLLNFGRAPFHHGDLDSNVTSESLPLTTQPKMLPIHTVYHITVLLPYSIYHYLKSSCLFMVYFDCLSLIKI